MARRSKTSPPPSLQAPALSLPAELTIYTAGELHPQWLGWLHGLPTTAPGDVQAAAVEQVDGAGMQLLLALGRGLAERGHALRLHAPSGALRSGAAALGLNAWLQQHSTQEATA